VEKKVSILKVQWGKSVLEVADRVKNNYLVIERNEATFTKDY
jgi:hypothetical protein